MPSDGEAIGVGWMPPDGEEAGVGWMYGVVDGVGVVLEEGVPEGDGAGVQLGQRVPLGGVGENSAGFGSEFTKGTIVYCA